jgi:two-component system sensor histidine kinase KdpD
MIDLPRRVPTNNIEQNEIDLQVEPAGKFRIYLGSAAGVGKTVSMLDEGLRRLNRGTDVVIGIVDTHKRPFTELKAQAIEAIPRKKIEYKGKVFEEFDLQAVFERNPEVVLIDELAHTNIPGSGPHEKRWQDVIEILESGISVITTVNIQHVESLADAVEAMTGVKVRERVPDWVLRRADQIELVDSSPEQLRRRLLHGNIYPADKIPTALTHFFKYENLAALRELALRFLADETEEEMLNYLSRIHSEGQWETTERIMVAVTGVSGSDQMLRRAARIAARARSDLKVVHVVQSDSTNQQIRSNLEKLHALSDDLGAHWVELQGDDIAETLVHYARSERITQVVIGSTHQSKWSELFRGSINKRLMKAAAADGIDVHIIARRDFHPEN